MVYKNNMLSFRKAHSIFNFIFRMLTTPYKSVSHSKNFFKLGRNLTIPGFFVFSNHRFASGFCF